MSEFLSKLTSRKFWAAVAGLVTGLSIVFGLDEGVITTVSGAVVAAASVVTYIITEGAIDKEAVAEVVELTEDTVEALTNEEK